ncbi:MAG: XkdW protein [Neobacillus sp.]|nr:XkdW protein [Neobacillus sp.]
MQICWTIEKMFPDANLSNYEVFIYPDETWEITKWNLPGPQPTKEEIETYWVEHEQEIIDAHKSQPSEIDILGQQIVEKDIELLQMQKINNELGQQAVDHDIRLMLGGL